MRDEGLVEKVAVLDASDGVADGEADGDAEEVCGV